MRLAIHSCGEIGERVAVLGDPAAYEASRETGTVGDGHGDEAREDGQHEVERLIADEIEERSHRGRATVRTRAHARLVKQERKRHENAATNDERQHVRDAVHEVLVDLARHAFGFTGGRIV